ncbi:unnamed protein product [Discula destructiva]
MASAAKSLRLVCRSCRSHRPSQPAGAKVFVAWKSVSSGGGAVKESQVQLDDGPKPSPYDHWEVKAKAESEKFRYMEPGRVAETLLREDVEGADPAAIRGFNWASIDNELVKGNKSHLHEIAKPFNRLVKPKKDAFWDEDEPDNDLITNDDSDEFDENDMTDIAHAKMEEHREQREYARIAIWEMPLLAQFAKPFQPPTANEPLRFRYTSYMGEYHPAEKKIVVEFSPADFGLTEVQEMKLKKLAGSRYNPEKDVIKMSCESFEHQAQNKRHLAETVEQMLAEARDPTDTFEDVPLDLRHHKMKIKPKFPLEWRMSDNRMQQIHAYRQEAKRLEDEKRADGRMIDGLEVIQKALASREEKAAAPVPVLLAGSKQRLRAGARVNFTRN